MTVPQAPPPNPPPPPPLRREAPFVAGLLLAAALFSLLALLGAWTDWWSNDESYTWDMIQRTPGQIVARTAGDVHPPLHYLALRAWRAFLPQPRGMRAFSLLVGLGGILAAGLIGRCLRGPRLGLLAAFLWASFPLFLHHSQDGRMYASALFLEMLALLGWAMAPWRPGLGWGVMAFGLLAGCYTHNFCLLFAAALLGGEALRVLYAYSRFSPRERPRPGLRWVFSAALVVGLGYAPWFFILLRQAGRTDYLAPFYQSPTWSEVALKLFYYPYRMILTGSEAPWGWLPGVLLLGLLPALWFLGGLLRRFKRNRPMAALARPVGMTVWVGAAPLGFLVLYSMFVNPMLEMTRHGLLFIPFLLFSAAAWLEAGFASRRGRVLALFAIAVSAGYALPAMSRSRDKNLRPHIEALLDRAPLGPPIVFYPPVFSYARLMWSPLPFRPHEKNNGTDRLTSCTLVVDQSLGMAREEIKRQVKRTLAQAASVREIYSTYDLAAYHVTGLPPRALDALLWRQPGAGVDAAGSLTGRWLPSRGWAGRGLAALASPAAELTAFLQLNPDWLGSRLAAPRTTFALPAADPAAGAFAAVLAGGYCVPDGETTATLRWDLPGGTPDETVLDSGDFMVARLVSLPSAPPRLSFEIPESLTRRRFAPRGDTPPGVYLTWAGLRPLKPEDFRQPGFDGQYFDVGALGDEVCLRSGFHEAEGMPPSEVRWTRGRFVVELPVWPSAPMRRVVLIGMLPKEVRDRTIELEVAGPAGRRLQARTTFEKSDYGEYVLTLPEPLQGGVQRFAFTVGTFSPSEAGQGSDARRLGFFLGALALRM